MTVPLSLREGRLVGDRYCLEALIGTGGMGEVWRARHVALKTPVAIKFLRGAPTPSERAKQRFLTEAQVTANLRTRHAVQVFDFGVTDDGLPYLVMELLEGETLDRRIARQGRLSIAETSQVLQKAARALERAHALGIVHRDFKPENVMLVVDEEEGGEQVKVVDFGIAKLVGDLDATLKMALSALAQRRSPSAAAVVDRTTGGVGTPQYMAPEQVEDSALVGPAADIWAFGVVAYECLTGRRPFEDDSMGKLLLQVLAAAPTPPSALAPLPELFDDWFRVACAREPGDRFPDVQTAAAALAVALEAGTPVANADAPRPTADRSSGHAIAARVPDVAPTLSSRQELVSTSDLEAGSGASRHEGAEAITDSSRRPASPRVASPLVVSPLAVTLEGLPARPAPDVFLARAPALGPRVMRPLSAAMALAGAVLALVASLRGEPDHAPKALARATANAADPAALAPPPIEAVALHRPFAAPAATAPAEPEPEPAPPASAAPPRPRARARASDVPTSAYRLPPLGL